MLITILKIIPIFIALVIIYQWARYASIKRIRYRRYFAQPGVFEGESVLLVEKIANTTLMPLFFVDVDAVLHNDLRLPGRRYGGMMQRYVSRFFLMPFTRVKRTVKIECVRRGYYELDTVSIYFFMKSVYASSRAALHVYPRAVGCEESNPLETQMQNTERAEKRLLADPFSFSGVREYRPGDPFGSVNYKATARTGVLKVNNRDFFSSRNYMIYIDFHTASFFESIPTTVYGGLMEGALSYASDMVWKSVRSGYGVGFAANCRMTGGAGSVRFPMRRGHDHYVEILREMAKIRTTPGNSFDWLIRQDVDALWNADVYIMTVHGTEQITDLIEMLKVKGNHVSIIKLA